MEVVETPTFWCPHVEHAACTNFSPRTVKLRPPESREIFPFPFSSFSFSFLSPYEFFSFLFFSFSPSLLFFPFCFPFLFLIFPLIPLSISPHFLFALSPPFWSTPHIRTKREISSPFLQTKCVALNFPSLFLIS